MHQILRRDSLRGLQRPTRQHISKSAHFPILASRASATSYSGASATMRKIWSLRFSKCTKFYGGTCFESLSGQQISTFSNSPILASSTLSDQLFENLSDHAQNLVIEVLEMHQILRRDLLREPQRPRFESLSDQPISTFPNELISKSINSLSLQLMESLKQKLAALQAEISSTVITDAATLEAYRIKFLGTKGLVKDAFGAMKDVAPADKKEAGAMLNAFKQFAEAHYENNKQTQGAGADKKGHQIDFSLPGLQMPVGTRHPLKVTENEIVSIFNKIGFTVAEGPEIEDDWHNFTSLNMPADHTARDMQDTFYVAQNPDWILRTHTSSTQARVLEEGNLPVRVICPGRVYRNETISARAHCFFHQTEGLYIDKKISFADLKQTLYYFVKEMFGSNTKVRFRPSYFPFTEPSAEMDISCTVCGGKGCNLCKHTGWVEILGCGMVHPDLLRNFNIDPEVYSGFAFGMGVERITQIKYQVNDLRLYSQNDVRFLKQFTAIQE